MRRFLRVAAVVLGLLVGAAVLAFFAFRGPDPETILARIERPPSPELEPAEALDAFRVADGFRVELVAAEPLVVDPVAMDWDDEGRVYVAEMRGYMPDIEGNGEERPVGVVAVLEDVDGDGRMDTRRVFADGLVLPRAVTVLPEGVLIAEPGALWLCRDTTGDGACDDKRRLGDYALEGSSVEHRENALLPGLDGWLYNSKSERRLRLEAGRLVSAPTPFRGQWGLAQDDEGLLYSNHNSSFLYGEVFPGEYAMRQPATAARTSQPGVNVPLAEGEQVWGIRVQPGLNRAYSRGTLRADGRQKGPTGVSGVAIQRGDQFGPDYVGDAFVPESAGAAVAHFVIHRDGESLTAEHRLTEDAEWEQREFLASTDERFRPVDVKVGPDGAIWVIDMYRGVIQHAVFVSDYLREYIEEHDLAPPGARGRLWRIVRSDREIEHRAPPLATFEDRIAALDHANGWARDRAQRGLVHAADPRTRATLSPLDQSTALGRVHALWTLAGMGALDGATWRRGLEDADPRVRRAALRAGEPLLDEWVGAGEEVAAMLDDPDALVRLQALHTLGAPLPSRAVRDRMSRLARSGSAITRQAALSGLAGVELVALAEELAVSEDVGVDEAGLAWLAELAGGAHRAAQGREDEADRTARLLDRIAASPPPVAIALLDGIDAAQRTPGSKRVQLDAAHPLFDEATERDEALAAAIARVRPHVTWVGDPRPGGARALSEDEEALRVKGEALFATSCAGCHGRNGAGLTSLAPPLIGSPWVRDADAWLVRIMLHGVTGPLEIAGETWNATMPGHGQDPRFDDAGVAAVATHLRRAWGHGDDPVGPETVAAIRAAESDRRQPWTVAELASLPIAHRLDRYAGRFDIRYTGLSFEIERRVAGLVVGRGDGAVAEMLELGLDTFSVPDQGLYLVFRSDEAGTIVGAEVNYQGTNFSLDRAD